jgi:hypothetical protein
MKLLAAVLFGKVAGIVSCAGADFSVDTHQHAGDESRSDRPASDRSLPTTTTSDPIRVTYRGTGSGYQPMAPVVRTRWDTNNNGTQKTAGICALRLAGFENLWL